MKIIRIRDGNTMKEIKVIDSSEYKDNTTDFQKHKRRSRSKGTTLVPVDKLSLPRSVAVGKLIATF